PAAQLAVLRTVPFLALLPLQTNEYLAEQLERVELPAGATLFSEGDAGDRFYILERGTLEIDLPEGVKVEEAPAFVGEIALLRESGAGAYAAQLERHRDLLREVFERHEGVEVDTQGDSFFVAFARASAAAAAAREGQDALLELAVRVRMGLHTGEPLLTDG